MSTEIVLLDEGAIKDRVATTNKFTRDEIDLHRKEITLARKEKRRILKEMNLNAQDSRTAVYREKGFTQVVDMKEVVHKNGDEFLVTKIKRVKPKAKSIDEMSVDEIVKSLGDKGADVLKSLVARAHSKAAIDG